MADLTKRMQQVAKGPASAGPAPAEPFRAAAPVFVKRVTLDLTAEDHRTLKRAALDEDVAMAEVLRTLLGVYFGDHALQARVRDQLKA